MTELVGFAMAMTFMNSIVVGTLPIVSDEGDGPFPAVKTLDFVDADIAELAGSDVT